jgi:ribonuclease P protein component
MLNSSFTKKEHLKKGTLIRQVFDKGLPQRGRLINIYLLRENHRRGFNRVAFIVKKDLYNKKLVLRNRYKRILREAYRKTKYLLPSGFDIVILATGLKKDTKSLAVERELRDVFKKYIGK